MTDLSVSHQERAQSKPQKGKRLRISPAVAKAVGLLLTGECKTQRAAAKRAGLNADYLCTALKKPQVQVFIARRTRETIANARLPAAATVVRLLEAESEHVQRDVAFRVLEETGDMRTANAQVTVNVDVSPGYVLDLRDAPLRQHEPQGQAKALENKGSVPNDE
jgi:phage terminase small subunit